MYIICGLGNPGNKYKYTRHNIGFLFLDLLAESLSLNFKSDKKTNSLYLKTDYQNEHCLLLKPLTYMNLSGECILSIASFYKVDLKKILIIHDDIDLPFNAIKIKSGGGTAGHNGLKSIVSKIGNDFNRIRIGIGRPPAPIDTATYVLQNFSLEEMKSVPKILLKTQDALDYVLTLGVDKAMSTFNKK